MYIWAMTISYRTKFRQTKYFVRQNFRHQAKNSTILSDSCLTFVLKYRTKFSTDKIFRRTKLSTLKISTILSDEFLSNKVFHLATKLLRFEGCLSDKTDTGCSKKMHRLYDVISSKFLNLTFWKFIQYFSMG